MCLATRRQDSTYIAATAIHRRYLVPFIPAVYRSRGQISTVDARIGRVVWIIVKLRRWRFDPNRSTIRPNAAETARRCPAAGIFGTLRMCDRPSDTTDSMIPDNRLLLLVGGLLLIIIVSLAVLWITERKRRVQAQLEVIRMRQAAQTSALPPGIKLSDLEQAARRARQRNGQSPATRSDE